MKKIISAAEFDRRFDEGEDISDYVDWSTAKRPNLEKKRGLSEPPPMGHKQA